MRRAGTVFLGSALMLVVLAVSALGAAAPRKDQFSGRISGASGRYAADHGRVSIRVTVPNSSHTTRPMTLTVRGTSCGKTRHCLALSAKLTGVITRLPVKVPDVGQSESLRASGNVKPLGQTSLTGTIQGTGMIGRGRESMVLTLKTEDGQLTVRAQSPLVPGFTIV